MLFTFLTAKAQNDIYHSFLNLQFESTRKLIDSKETIHPYDLYIANINDCLELIINEKNNAYDDFIRRSDSRIKFLRNRESNPQVGFALGEIYLQKSFIEAKYGHEWQAFWSLRSALKEVEQNINDYPEFLLNNRTLGLLHICLDLVPENKKWLMRLMGMEGDFLLGYDKLQITTQLNGTWAKESSLLIQLIDVYLLEKRVSLDSEETNPLFIYIQGLLQLKQHEALNAKSSFEKLHEGIQLKPYLLGEAHFGNGQYKKAIAYYKTFLSQTSGYSYLKDAHFKVGLSYWFMEGDDIQADYYFKKAIEQTKSKSEADRNAARLLDEINKKDKTLLQLRFVIDGGHLKLAKSIISQIDPDQLTDDEKLEFNYRKARYYDFSKENEHAISHYKRVVQTSESKTTLYFVPYSYLQLGHLSRINGDFTSSRSYYEDVLTFKNYPYKQSIDLKAGIGLASLDQTND